MPERPSAPDPAVGWVLIETAAKQTWIRIMAPYELKVEKQGHDWWVCTVTETIDGGEGFPVPDPVFADEASGMAAAQRKAELYVWHRNHGGKRS